MPQEFQVLRCYSCEKFQVHQTKKAKKWECKVCGEKQSLKKAYFTGSAKDCRTNVQQLNFEDGQKKQDRMLQETNENFEEDDSFDSVAENNDAYEFENIPFESINWDETPACMENQSSPLMPQKKRKYAEDTLSEIYNEDPSSGFEEHKKYEMITGTNITSETSSQEKTISFDVSFDCNSVRSSTDTFKTNNKDLKLNKENNSEPPIKKRKNLKNKGFQLIMNAAKKLNADSESF